MNLHPSAQVDPTAELADDVEIGPFCRVGPGVRLGPGCRLLARVSIHGPARIGRNNRFYPNVAIGGPPQDLQTPASDGCIEIGDDNVFREGVTVHLPKLPGNATRVGSRNRFHCFSHVGHDSTIGNEVILETYVVLGGHTVVQDGARIGSLGGTHQFVTVGRCSLSLSHVPLTEDVPPFMWVDGNHFEVRGVNPRFRTEALERAYATVWKSGLPRPESLALLERDPSPEVRELAAFLRRSAAGRFGRAGEASRGK